MDRQRSMHYAMGGDFEHQVPYSTEDATDRDRTVIFTVPETAGDEIVLTGITLAFPDVISASGADYRLLRFSVYAGDGSKVLSENFGAVEINSPTTERTPGKVAEMDFLPSLRHPGAVRLKKGDVIIVRPDIAVGAGKELKGALFTVYYRPV